MLNDCMPRAPGAPFATAGPPTAPQAHRGAAGWGLRGDGAEGRFTLGGQGSLCSRLWGAKGLRLRPRMIGRRKAARDQTRNQEAGSQRLGDYPFTKNVRSSKKVLLLFSKVRDWGGGECWNAAQESQRFCLPSLLAHRTGSKGGGGRGWNSAARHSPPSFRGADAASHILRAGKTPLWLTTLCCTATFFCSRSCVYLKPNIGVPTVSRLLL